MNIQSDALADTVPAACARLGVSRSTLYLEIAAGRLRGVKAGGRTLVRRDDQQAWMDSLPAIGARQAA